jgi:outer membrane lipoprotein SlyB
LRNGRSVAFHTQIEKVFATESVKSVDEEGNVESCSKTKEAEIRALGGAAPGAIIGSVVGGGKGAAIGAIIFAGGGSDYVQGDKDLILEPGAQMIARATVLDREGVMTRL